eukprot:11810670-Alexandrium_andersonii.AAC.1
MAWPGHMQLPHGGQSGDFPVQRRVRAPPAPAQCRFFGLTVSTLGGGRSAWGSGPACGWPASA